MAAPLIDAEHVVGEWDADVGGWWARDWTPGPAGTAGLALAGGIELDVDVASPATLVGLWVPSPLPRRGTRAVRHLLGDERAAALLALGVDGAPGGPAVLGPGRVRRLGPPRRRDRAAPRVADRQRGGAGAGLATPLARLGLASLPSVAASPVALVRALGHLDAADATLAIGAGIGVGAAGRAHALAAAELLLDLARRGELDDRPIDGSGLLAALDRIGGLLPDGPAAGVRSLRGDLLAGVVAPAPAPVADPGRSSGEGVAGGARARRAAPAGGVASEAADAADAAMPAPAAAPMALEREAVSRTSVGRRSPVGHVVAVDRAGLPLAFAVDEVAARTTTPSEIELRIAGRGRDSDRWWARAIDGAGHVVAAAPLLAVGDDAVARLLVPPAQLTELLVDVTDRPGEPRPSAAALEVLAAVATGQAAARAERLGRTGDAAARWHRAAAAWDRAGAPQRAGLARELAAGTRGERVPPPLLADALVEAIEG